MPYDISDEERREKGLKPYCPCGSGWHRRGQYDGYGIFLTYTCEKCHNKKMRSFRSDIHTRYDTDETIDED